MTTSLIRAELDKINEKINKTRKEDPIYSELVKEEAELFEKLSDRQSDLSKYGRGLDPEEVYYSGFATNCERD